MSEMTEAEKMGFGTNGSLAPNSVRVCPKCRAEYRHNGIDCGNHVVGPDDTIAELRGVPTNNLEKAIAAAKAKYDLAKKV